jgi:hypothetical protein
VLDGRAPFKAVGAFEPMMAAPGEEFHKTGGNMVMLTEAMERVAWVLLDEPPPTLTPVPMVGDRPAEEDPEIQAWFARVNHGLEWSKAVWKGIEDAREMVTRRVWTVDERATLAQQALRRLSQSKPKRKPKKKRAKGKRRRGRAA